MIIKKLIKPISKVGVANVDLDNYYTKAQVDSKVETINNEIDTKQDMLSAGNNITISNNVISATIPPVDLSNYYTKSEINNKVNSLIKTTTFTSQASFVYVDELNVNNQRYRWYRVNTSNTPLNANNCLNIEYKTTDPKEITFSYKWESDTSILLTFCKVNGQQDYSAIGTLIAKYI